jgi:hypothetical protein
MTDVPEPVWLNTNGGNGQLPLVPDPGHEPAEGTEWGISWTGLWMDETSIYGCLTVKPCQGLAPKTSQRAPGFPGGHGKGEKRPGLFAKPAGVIFKKCKIVLFIFSNYYFYYLR